MIYKNIEIYNAEEIVNEENGSISWMRVPNSVYEKIESEQGKKMATGSTGIELRFVMNSDSVTFRMRTKGEDGAFHVYRGSIQGCDQDHEVNKNVGNEFTEFVIKKSSNADILDKISKEFNHPFSSDVIRVIFDRGWYEILDIDGDVKPPEKEQKPKKTLLAYGSSITHGSNSIDSSHSWVSVVAHNLKMDSRNLGMAGSCRMEPEFVEYIASEGEKGNWDVAVLELGINVLAWEKEQIIKRVENTLKQIAGRNQDKPILVISPFYSFDDYKNEGQSDKWRTLIEKIVNELDFSNVTYVNGLDLLGDMSLISADEVHPNIYGVMQIAQRVTKILENKVE